MSLYLDEKYIGFLSPRLRNFSRKGRSLYIFSCPNCGDSRKSKRAAHCYAFPASDGMRVYCHRCGWSRSLIRAIKELDPELYREYLVEEFGDRDRKYDEAVSEEVAKSAPVPDNPMSGLLRCSAITDPSHPAVRLLNRRLIPEDRWPDIWHADDFRRFANRLKPEKYKPSHVPEARLIIPIRDRSGALIGFQGRSYETDSQLRYISVSLDDEPPFLYGQERLRMDLPKIAVEGPIDSMFLVNAVASAGGKIERELEKAGLDKRSVVVAYDNEPRSSVTVQKMERAIEAGFRVVVWPGGFTDKDVNDAVMRMVDEGHTVETAVKIMTRMCHERAFAGLEARLVMSEWRRIRTNGRSDVSVGVSPGGN